MPSPSDGLPYAAQAEGFLFFFANGIVWAGAGDLETSFSRSVIDLIMHRVLL